MRIISFLLLLLLSATLQAQPMNSTAIDSLVERTLRTFEVPGIAVCLIKDGKVIHSKGYGVRSLNTRQPVDENTLFGIASNSKAFTTAALGSALMLGIASGHADPLAMTSTVPAAPIGHLQPRAQQFSPRSPAEQDQQQQMSKFDAEQQKLDERLDKSLNICRC